MGWKLALTFAKYLETSMEESYPTVPPLALLAQMIGSSLIIVPDYQSGRAINPPIRHSFMLVVTVQIIGCIATGV